MRQEEDLFAPSESRREAIEPGVESERRGDGRARHGGSAPGGDHHLQARAAPLRGLERADEFRFGERAGGREGGVAIAVAVRPDASALDAVYEEKGRQRSAMSERVAERGAGEGGNRLAVDCGAQRLHNLAARSVAEAGKRLNLEMPADRKGEQSPCGQKSGGESGGSQATPKLALPPRLHR